MTEADIEKAHAALLKRSNEALDLISNAEKKAKQNIASEAADALKVRNKEGNDHDLLIEVRTKLDRVLDDIQSIIASGENKVDQAEFDALKNEVRGPRENRMRSLENKTAGIWITISIYSLAIVALFTVIMNHISKMP